MTFSPENFDAFALILEYEDFMFRLWIELFSSVIHAFMNDEVVFYLDSCFNLKRKRLSAFRVPNSQPKPVAEITQNTLR